MDILSIVNELYSSACLLHQAFVSIHSRFQHLSTNPTFSLQLAQLYQNLHSNLQPLPQQLQNLHANLSQTHQQFVVDRITTLQQYVTAAHAQIVQVQTNSPGWIRKFRDANKINEWLGRLKTDGEKAQDDLMQLIAFISQANGFHTLHMQVSHVHDRINLGLNTGNIATDLFKPSFHVPPNPSHVLLQFDAWSELVSNRSHAQRSLESQLKYIILLEKEKDAANVVAVKGMSGVGKTCALRGLVEDVDVRAKFKHGVYFVSLGEDASEASLIRQLGSIVKQSGGNQKFAEIKTEKDLDLAIHDTKQWFTGKCILLLVDDVWPGRKLPLNILRRIALVLDELTESRLVFSTRHADVAIGSRVVRFGKRDQIGARALLLKCAGFPQTVDEMLEKLVVECLSHCDGLPIAIAVSGRAVAKRHDAGICWKQAFREYLAILKSEQFGLLAVEDWHYEHTSILCAYQAALRMLDEDFKVNQNFLNFNMPLSRMYRAMIVQKKQEWVPMRVLQLLWDVDEVSAGLVMQAFADRSLAERREWTVDGVSHNEMSLHDVQLAFVQTICRQMNESTFWPEKLIRCWLSGASEGNVNQESRHRKFWNSTTLSFTAADISRNISQMKLKLDQNGEPRSKPFNWQVDRELRHGIADLCRKAVCHDDYFRQNLCRHLLNGDLLKGLFALLLNPMWTVIKLRAGEGLSLDEDFEILLEHMKMQTKKNMYSIPIRNDNVLFALDMIRRSAILSSAQVSKNGREAWFQLWTRLLQAGKTSHIITEYLQDAEEYAEGLWVKTNISCLLGPGGPLHWSSNCGGQVEKIYIPHGREKLYLCGIENGRGFVTTIRKGVVEKKAYLPAKESFREPASSHSVACSGIVHGVVQKSESTTSFSKRLFLNKENPMALVSSISIKSDGTKAVTGHEDGSMRIWNTKTGKGTCTLTTNANCIVKCVEFSKNGELLACGCDNGEVSIWDLMNEEGFDNIAVYNHNATVTCLEWSKTELSVASGAEDGTIYLWNRASRILKNTDNLQGHVGWVKAITWSPNGHSLASGGADGVIRIWEIDRKLNPSAEMISYASSVTSMEWSGDGRILATGGIDGTVRMWDARSFETIGDAWLERVDGVRSLAWSADDRLLASGGARGSIQMWDLDIRNRSGNKLCKRCGWVTCVSRSENSRFMALGGDDGAVFIFNTRKRKIHIRIMECHQGGVVCTALSKDGHTLITAGKDNMIRVWNLKNGGSLLINLYCSSNLASCISWNEKKSLIASGANDGSISIWNLKQERCVKVLTKNHLDKVRCIAWSVEGKFVASGGNDGIVRVWDLQTENSSRCTLSGHVGAVTCITWSLDGDLIAAGGDDGTVRVWNLRSSEELWNVHCVVSFLTCSMQGDCQVLHTPSRNFGWDMATGKSLSPKNRKSGLRLEWENNGICVHIRDRKEKLATIERELVGVSLRDSGGFAFDALSRAFYVFEIKKGNDGS